MKTQSLGFIGSGRITKIMLKAFSNANIKFSSILVYDINSEISQALKNQFSDIEIVDSLVDLTEQDLLVVALHPPAIIETLQKIKDFVNERTIILSLAPKITIEAIANTTAVKKIARLIPNATSYINEGYNPVCFSKDFPNDEKILLNNMLNSLGKTVETEEQKLEAYAIISAMLPTYFWFQWDEIQKIGTQIGLNEEESKEAIKETLLSAIHLFYDSGLTSKEVIDLIPVKPLGNDENTIKGCFNNCLIPLFEKIKPQ